MFGHVTRMPQERSARQVLLATPKGKRPRGRARTRWCYYISDLACNGLFLAWNQQNYQDFWKPWGISSHSKAAALRSSPEKMRAWKWIKVLDFFSAIPDSNLNEDSLFNFIRGGVSDAATRLEQWFSNFHDLWPPSMDFRHLWPLLINKNTYLCFGFCNITAELFNKGLC